MSYFNCNTTDQENKNMSILPSEVENIPHTEENWDNDNAGTYDPLEHVVNKMVIRCLIRASKAEKRKFRKMERSRILKLLECELPFINNLKQLTLEDDTIWEQLSHMCKLTIHDSQTSYEQIRQEFIRMKISHS